MKAGRFFGVTILWVMLYSISFGNSGWTTGKVGNALAFDGINDYVDVAGYKGITATASRTCSAWIKTVATQQGNIVSWGAEQNGQRWSFRIESNGTLGVGVYGGVIDTTATVNDGQWHYVAAVLNDDGSPSVNEIQIYIDGIVKATTATSSQSISTVASQNVMIGAFKTAGVPTSYFNGLIDEVCIYNRALDASEINPQAPIPAEGLGAYWAMDETQGKIAHDSVSSYDGTLTNFKYSGGSGTAADPYKIASKSDLLELSAAIGDYNKCFILTADIDLEGQIFTDAIIKRVVVTQPPQEITFNGTLDGKGHCIKNFAITAPSIDYVGLFGYVKYGIIKNLGVENNGIQGRAFVGGLAGYNRGTITNCYTIGSVSSSNNTEVSTGLLQRVISCVGGLIGYTEGSSIMDCYSHCSVNASAVVSSSSIEAYILAGGLIGESHGTITNCYSTGSVVSNAYSSNYDSYSFTGGLAGIGDTVTNCYSTGTVTASSNGYGYLYKGGLVGSGLTSNITNSFWDTQTSGLTTSAGGTGKTTAEMKTLSTFTDSGWDFAEDWSICEGTNYPRLTWQIPEGDWVCPDGVNTEDLDYFVGRWLLTNCTVDNNYCDGADVDSSGTVDLADYAILAGHWLEM